MSLGQLGSTTLGNLSGASQNYAGGASDAYGTMGAARASNYQNQGDILNQLLKVGSQAYGQYKSGVPQQQPTGGYNQYIPGYNI